MRRRVLWRIGLACVVVLGTALAPVAASAQTAGLNYVNMGDSYSAGAGIQPPAPSPYPPPQCLQSALNWGHDIARAKGYRLTDVSCSGAETKDYRTSQSPGVRPQLDVLSGRTRVVTMTIGGNDNGVFIGTIQKCGAAAATTAGQGNPCEQQYGQSFENTIRTSTYRNLVRTLGQVRSKAPNARVGISSYLRILPQAVGCYPIMPVASGDVPYLNRIQATLNSVVKQAADQAGVTFIDQSVQDSGHDACKPIGVRWIEPVLGTTNPIVVHPNALGEQAMANQAIATQGLLP